MVFKSNATSGDNGNSIVGSGNNLTTYNFDSQIPKRLKRSVIFDVCKIISELDINYDDEYSIQNNSDWMNKFEYNDVSLYIEIFENYSDNYDEVYKVLNTYLKKIIMVKKVRSIYLKVEDLRKKGNYNGDFVIEEVFELLKEEVCFSALMNESNLLDEEVDEAIYMIMFYTFSKCKLLKPLPKGGVS